MAIWRYQLSPDTVSVMAPKGAKPIRVAMQRGTAYIWAIVDPDAELVSYAVSTIGTGWRFPDDVGEYIGSFTAEDIFEFHVFWR